MGCAGRDSVRSRHDVHDVSVLAWTAGLLSPYRVTQLRLLPSVAGGRPVGSWPFLVLFRCMLLLRGWTTTREAVLGPLFGDCRGSCGSWSTFKYAEAHWNRREVTSPDSHGMCYDGQRSLYQLQDLQIPVEPPAQHCLRCRIKVFQEHVSSWRRCTASFMPAPSHCGNWRSRWPYLNYPGIIRLWCKAGRRRLHKAQTLMSIAWYRQIRSYVSCDDDDDVEGQEALAPRRA